MTAPLPSARYRREIEHHAHAERAVEIREVSAAMIPWNLRAFERVLGSCVGIARRFCEAIGVEDRVDVRVAAMEEMYQILALRAGELVT